MRRKGFFETMFIRVPLILGLTYGSVYSMAHIDLLDIPDAAKIPIFILACLIGIGGMFAVAFVDISDIARMFAAFKKETGETKEVFQQKLSRYNEKLDDLKDMYKSRVGTPMFFFGFIFEVVLLLCLDFYWYENTSDLIDDIVLKDTLIVCLILVFGGGVAAWENFVELTDGYISAILHLAFDCLIQPFAILYAIIRIIMVERSIYKLTKKMKCFEKSKVNLEKSIK